MTPYAESKIEAFLNRKLRDSRRVKKAPLPLVEKTLKRRGFNPPVELWELQKRCAVLGTKFPAYVFLLDMGLGKTMLTLSLLDHRLKRGEVERAIVVTPFTSVIDEWRRECANFPRVRMVGLDGSAEENEAGWNDEEANLLVCTVPMMLMKAKASAHSKTARKRKKGERATKEDRAAERADKKTAEAGMLEFVERFDFFVFDESSAMRSRDSLIFKFLDRVGEAIPYRYLLTGTPMDSDPQELWPQFKIVDRGWSLGETITMFREAFFTRSKSKFGRFSFDYVLKRGAMKMIHRRTRHSSVRYEAREHKQMPTMIGGLGAKAFNNRFVDLPPATTRIYNSIIQEIRAAKGDTRAVEQNYIRMRQVCSGYMSLPEDLDRIQVSFPNNPKVDALLEILEQLPESARVLVACWYQPTARLMEKGLAKYKPWRIDGSVPAKARKAALAGFRSGGKRRVLIGTVAIGYGTNIQQATHIVFVESPDSHIDRSQFERRLLRGDSKHKPTCIDIVVRNSVEERIQTKLLSKDKRVNVTVKGLKLKEL